MRGQVQSRGTLTDHVMRELWVPFRSLLEASAWFRIGDWANVFKRSPCLLSGGQTAGDKEAARCGQTDKGMGQVSWPGNLRSRPSPTLPDRSAGRVSPSLPRPLLSHSLNKGAHEHFNRDILKLLHLSLVFVIWVQRQT